MAAKYDDHILDAAHQASQDFDAWILKLGTAGLTLVLLVAGLVTANSLTWLVAGGFGFALSLAAGLLSLRLSSIGLKDLAEGTEYDDIEQFKWVRHLNWAAFAFITLAFVSLALFVALDAQVKETGT